MELPVVSKCGSENPKRLFCTACGQALHHAQNDPPSDRRLAWTLSLGRNESARAPLETIYRAEHTTLRRRMAVKLLHQQLAQNEDAVERFLSRSHHRLRNRQRPHPQVFDFGRAEDGRLFFAMEFLDGVPLSMVMEREGRLTPERTTDILTRLPTDSMEAHTLGYIHRDLRPRSIFPPDDGTSRLCKDPRLWLAKLVFSRN